MQNFEQGPEFTVNPDLLRQKEDKKVDLARELGHEPSDFELGLLADPKDKNEQKRNAVMDMFNKGLDAPLPILRKIVKPEHHIRVRDLVASYMKTCDFSLESGSKDSPAKRREMRDQIRRKMQEIIDEALEE